MWPLNRLRKNLQLLEHGRALHHGIRAAVRIGRADAQHFFEFAARLAGFEVRDRLLMVPSCEYRWNREELSMMRERRLSPRLDNDLVGFLVVGAVALLVLDRREWPSEDFGLARLIAAANSEFEAAAADDVEHSGLLRDSNWMPPGDDVGGLTKPNLARPHCDRGLGEERIGAELRALGLEVMLGHEKVVEAEPVGENSLPHLADQAALAGFVNLGEVAVIDRHSRRGPHHREIGCTVVENAYLDHISSTLRRGLTERAFERVYLQMRLILSTVYMVSLKGSTFNSRTLAI